MNTEKQWTEAIKKKMVGRTITAVRYMTAEEAEDLGFSVRPIVLMLDDGSDFFPQSDDEGNDGGALSTSWGGALEVIPVM